MNRSFDIIGKRKIWYVVSLCLIIPGLISLMFRGLNLGIDFTGGNLIQVQYAQTVKIDQIRTAVSEYVQQAPVITESENNVFMIRTGTLNEAKNNEIVKSLAALGENKILRNEQVGAIIGKEITLNAIYALIIASILMIIYITFRFELNFAIAAIMALLHDVLVILGVFSLFQIEVDGAFVAAILTIVGYSINDTIVIFDRIRENLNRRGKEDIEVLANNSIMQTMARSINTVLTVLFTLFALLLFGGETTKIFSLALLVGITSGCYSSMFNATPIWIELRHWSERRKRMAKA